MRDVVSILHPIYKVLRIVDNEIYLAMRSIYKEMQLMKGGIKLATPRSSKWVHQIINDRWDKTLKHPLHKAGKLINYVNSLNSLFYC